MTTQGSILCVANYPSDVGYAWWLMESYWIKISETFTGRYQTFVAYPQINTLPVNIAESQLTPIEYAFSQNSIKQVLNNMSFIRRHNIKVLYLSDHSSVSLVYAMYRMAGVETIIVHDHTPGLRTEPRGVKKWLKTIWARLPFIHADAAFGATEFVRQRLVNVSCMPKSRCYAIQNGIEFSEHNEKHNHPLVEQLPKDKKIIVTASRANKYKGIQFALDVIAYLVHQKGITDLVYLFCGDGPDLEEFKRYATKLKIEPYCYFPGRVDQIQQLFKSCHVAFQPSSGEVGYSLSILEYMVNKLPVIVPDNPSVCGATAHGTNGQVYNDKSIQGAADSIALYLTNEHTRKQHGDEAKQSVLANYTLTSTHQALKNALITVVNKNN
ncbi:glycosyltransferase family 4 protein [Alteromonas sp. ASW11-130]|uniref:glycosyltransferase family 4 protein n=1 Tax=Alteromonas sp. ASW11-130 TaxID=3015775 RepID=UPI0022423FF1|nr:glycosyltransferase family 4 protein [Alteromonas sp. ASW11-130]MCW8091280.1 glycosyltransferase family 4 protein [Alteromonas sp. ASW11-130]